ncbi:hypothetical protein [Novosphingobium lentum]|uniref:hypothetical protein n=1 Tax=Novosphingobium lentum TaxID=145287 RepID=UPI00082D0449|nr:hypothetical protein [Novosphingobium lentum]
MSGDFVSTLPWLIGGGLVMGFSGVIGWIYTTRLKIHHGYPLEGMWGQSLKPGMGSEAAERVKLLSQENAALRAEIGSIKDRLGNVERIVTDSGYGLGDRIEALRNQDAGRPAAIKDGSTRQ